MGVTVRVSVMIAVALCMVLGAGCFKFDARVDVRPDQSMYVEMLWGSLSQFAGEDGQDGDGPPIDPEVWQREDYAEDDWNMTRAWAVIKPGEALFAEEEAPQVAVLTSQHRLSTLYFISMSIAPPHGPAPPEAEMQPVDPEDGDVNGEVNMEGFDGMQQLFESMMSGIRFDFALSGPGWLRTTNGTRSGINEARWSYGMKEINAFEETIVLELVTEAPAWAEIGRLADEIMLATGMDDAGVLLADALRRGLLPNSEADADGPPEISAVDYARLLDIVELLDEVLPPAAVKAVFDNLGLNAPIVTAARIAECHDRLVAAEYAEIVNSAVIGAVTEIMDGRTP